MAGIRIVDNGNGTFGIESDYPGPFATLAVLEAVSAAIKKASLEGELRGAGQQVQEASPADKARLELADRWAQQRRNGGLAPG